VIHAPRAPVGSTARLLDAVRARGLATTDAESPRSEDRATLLLTTPVDWMALGVRMAPWRVARGARIVVLSRLGAHPDAVAPGLRDLWRLEEYARVSMIPTLTLRFGPLVGAESPFWRKLASAPKLGREASTVVMPVLEEDAVQVLARALGETRPAEGWFEVTGPEARSLAEWSALAAEGGARADDAEWEPPLEELLEHRLGEADVWQERFGLAAHSVSAWAKRS
jgi:hypothetical protein